MKYTTERNSWYLSTFATFERSLNGESESPVHSLRREAIRRFDKLGFPTNRHEEWRFTNIQPILKADLKPVLGPHRGSIPPNDIERLFFGTEHRLVFVNGYFAEALSSVGELPKGVWCGSLAAAQSERYDVLLQHLARYAKYDDSPFTALNTAFLREGAFIHVPDNTLLDKPIHLLYLTKDANELLISPRNLMVIGANSRASVVESYESLTANSYLTNVVTEIVLGENSVLEHDRLQDEGLQAFHVSSAYVHQQSNSSFISNSIALGGSIARSSVSAVLDGPGSECTLNGLSLSSGTQLIDNHTSIDHAQPNCQSHELYKAILDGKSRGVFNGKIFVRQDAQKTDAKQTNKTLLLSDQATIDTKPQLEIFADDVKCTHGATVGQLEAEQVFYLRTRGIDVTTARDILTFAFASDVVNRVHVEPLRDQLESRIHTRLDEGRKARGGD
jgi:Fe-S cluster assembly protein SufD